MLACEVRHSVARSRTTNSIKQTVFRKSGTAEHLAFYDKEKGRVAST